MKNPGLKMQGCEKTEKKGSLRLLPIITALLVIPISVLSLSGRVFAVIEEEIPEYKAKEIVGGVGYRSLSIDGYEGRVLEYDYPHSGAMGGIDYRYYTPLLKLYLEGGYLNKKDYSLGLDGRYKDVLWLRLSSDSLFHHLDHERLGPSSSDGTIRTQDMNPGEGYRLQSRDSKAFMKVKVPDYPAHIILEGRILEGEGLTQQRFLNENCVTMCHRISYSRNRDWKTEEFSIGLNGHLGPLELAYIHNNKTFKDKTETPSYLYGPNFGYRPAGRFEHNKNPELSSFSDTFKAHTSYTGRIVASGTYTTGKRENDTSGGHVDYKTGAGDFTWVPSGMLTIALKFRHLNLDVDNPDTVTVSNKEGTFIRTFDVRPSISSKRNTVNLILTYRPLKGVSIRGEYERAETERDNTAGRWGIPDKTIEDSIKITGRVRPSKTITIKLSYKYRDIDDLPYENQSSCIHEGSGMITWNPLTILGFSANYKIIRGEETIFERKLISDDLSRSLSLRKDNLRDNLSLLLTITPLKGLSLNANYSYLRDRITSDLLYGSDFFNPITKEDYLLRDENVPYEAKSHTISLGGNLNITKTLTLSAGVHRTKSEGAFYPNILTATNTFSGLGQLSVDTSGIGNFSIIDIVQDSFSIGCEYRFRDMWTGRIDYIYRDYDDKRDDSMDGDVNIVYLTLSKKW